MNITKVGIGILVLRTNNFNTQVLLGKRKGSHGEGEWASPGGHLEYGESFKDTAFREIAEEVGSNFTVKDLEVVSVINLVKYMPKHYIDIGMIAVWQSGEPKVMEPDKLECWKWFDINNLPSPRFATIDKIMEAAEDYKLRPARTAVVWDKE